MSLNWTAISTTLAGSLVTWGLRTLVTVCRDVRDDLRQTHWQHTEMWKWWRATINPGAIYPGIERRKTERE